MTSASESKRPPFPQGRCSPGTQLNTRSQNAPRHTN